MRTASSRLMHRHGRPYAEDACLVRGRGDDSALAQTAPTTTGFRVATACPAARLMRRRHQDRDGAPRARVARISFCASAALGC